MNVLPQCGHGRASLGYSTYSGMLHGPDYSIGRLAIGLGRSALREFCVDGLLAYAGRGRLFSLDALSFLGLVLFSLVALRFLGLILFSLDKLGFFSFFLGIEGGFDSSGAVPNFRSSRIFLAASIFSCFSRAHSVALNPPLLIF